MHTAGLRGSLALVLFAPGVAQAQERTWEWQWGMHPMVFMWGAGGLVMMLMMLIFWGSRDRGARPGRAMARHTRPWDGAR